MKKYIFLSLIMATSVACEKTIDFEIPYDPPKLTIDAKLRTGELVKAIVGTSQFSLSTETPNVDSLSTVFLYEDGILVEEMQPRRYSSDIIDNRGEIKAAFYYEGTYRPQPDHTYEVRAQRDGFTEARGNAFMYAPIEIVRTFYDSANGELSVSFTDPPGMGDYYRISISPRSSDATDFSTLFGSYDPTIEFFETDDFDDLIDQDGLSFGYAGYITDEFFDGGLKKLKLIYYGEGGPFAPQPIPGMNGSFDIIIGRVSRSYYLHERSKSAQTIETPFSEPTPIYGNVENGYGIVATSAIARVYIQN